MAESITSNQLLPEEVRAFRSESKSINKIVNCRHTADQIWPYISQVELYNRAGGSSPVEYEIILNPESASSIFGTSKKFGITMNYQEMPYEWIRPHFVHSEMFFKTGPFLYTRIRGEYLNEKSSFRYSIDYVPRHRFGIAGFAARGILNKFVKVFQHIDSQLPDSFNDPLGAKGFEERNTTTLNRAKKLSQSWSHLADDPVVPDSLADFIATAPDSLVGRLRPYALASHLGTTRSKTLQFCCRAANAGFLEISWDLICPSCGGAKERNSDWAELGSEAHCEMCNIRYDKDLEKNVELSFRPKPSVRNFDDQEYCLQSPSHQLQILAQVNIEPDSTYRLPLSLQPGHYRLRSIGREGEALFNCAYGRPLSEVEVTIGSKIGKIETQCGSSLELLLKNDSSYWRTVRFEHHGYREDAACAAEVLKLPEFCESFGEEVPNTFKFIS